MSMIPTDALFIISVLLLLVALFGACWRYYYKACPACHGRMERKRGRVRWKCQTAGCGYAEYAGEQV